MQLAPPRFAVLTALALCVSGSADELGCPPGAKLRVDEHSRGRAELCVDDAGSLDGPARMYVGDVLRREDSWQGGVQHGRAIVYDEHGVKREERFYQAGQLHGIETYFHANGMRQSVTSYDSGAKHGPIAQWDEEGRPLASGQFFAGEPDGLWLFSPPGEAPYARVFEEGKPAQPIDLTRGCDAWNEGSEAQRELFAAGLLLQAVAALDLDPKFPSERLALYRLRACVLDDPGRVARSITAGCAAPEPSFLGDASSNAAAGAVKNCLLPPTQERIP